jgi:cell division transport system permease protein
MLSGPTYFVTEAWVNTWRGRGAAILSTLTIAIAVFVLGLFLLAGRYVQRTVDLWGRSAEVSVYLHDEATEDQRAAVGNLLRRDPAVAAVEFVSKSQALARFRKTFPELAPASDLVGENPLPASFEVRVRPATSGAAMERLAARAGRLPGVADVRYDRQWLDRLASIGGVIRWTGWTMAAVLLLAAALTVTNVVRLSLHARRDEIEIMELMGAPLAFIRLPFVCEGMIQGAIGAALAVAVLEAGTMAAAPRLSALSAGLFGAGPCERLSGWAVAGLILGGTAVGCLGGLVASRPRR